MREVCDGGRSSSKGWPPQSLLPSAASLLLSFAPPSPLLLKSLLRLGLLLVERFPSNRTLLVVRLLRVSCVRAEDGEARAMRSSAHGDW